ncbi:MAG: hypothetical protein IJB91_02065 [Oscillospiraceae bacterium]|nr:hypothetical protein [Oscillospiraceae bacterium]
MKQLPKGVYCVSEAFAEKEGKVFFSFQDDTYEARLGENAFSCFEDLITQPLTAPQMPFCGYQDTPVILLPAGLYRAYAHATTKEESLRTWFPCPVTVLGENAGISPNGRDLRTENPQRRAESVIEGNFYFGCLAIRGELPGTMTVDGIDLQAKLLDERTGENATLAVKNCQLRSALVYDILSAPGKTSLSVSDCRADGMDACNGEGRLFAAGSGKLQVRRLYMAATDKFPGLSNYSRTAEIGSDTDILLQDCLLENCTAVRGLTFRLPRDARAAIRLENCQFVRSFPEDAAVWANLPNENCTLSVTNCRFEGAGDTAICYDGLGKVTVENTTQTGYASLCQKTKPRRTVVDPEKTYPITDPHTPVTGDFSVLDGLYAGRQLFYGDFHCHSDSGGTSDGKTPLRDYVPRMQELGMDFAAIVDHRQMRHFFLPEWDEQYLICGTEPGMRLQDPSRPPNACRFHYTMIFPDKTGLGKVFEAFPEFEFTGGIDGCTIYPGLTKERFLELAEFVWKLGGLLTHAHPRQLMASKDLLHYYFGDNVPLETVHGDVDAYATRQNRDLWVTLLNMGKRIRTHGSSDAHGPVSNRGLTAVYAPRHFSTDIFKVIRSGDCTAGGVAIQMSVEDCPMGSATSYAPGKKLYLRLNGFHFAHKKEHTVYCLKIYTDKGLAYAREFDGREQTLILPVQKRLYYRAEVTNESDGLPVAFSNPIWLE